MLKIENLSKVYKSTGSGPAGGIRDASFEIATGQFFTLLGPSGCGKTTTLRCIAGLNDPDVGHIAVEDRVLYDSAEGIAVPLHLRNIGMVFQSYAIWPHMSVGENVSFPMRVSRNPRYTKSEVAEATTRALRSVGLDGYANRSATQLSGGQQQRVAFARAIVLKPKLLLLDEPLSNLDAALREDMRGELKRLQQEIGITAVYVTHDQTEALAMSDHIAVIDKGIVVQQGNARDIYFHPENEFVAGFIGHANILQARTLADVAGGATGRVDIGTEAGIVCSFGQAFSAGAAVAVSVRPENITLHKSGDTALTEGRNALTGKVTSVSFLGNIMHYRVALGQHSVQVEAAPDQVFARGDEIVVSFHPKHTVAIRASQGEE